MTHILFVLTLAIFPACSYAASLSFERGAGTQVFLDAQHEPLNLVEGTITFPEGSVVRIETAESIVPLWIEEPRGDGATVRFAGLIPGGFHGVAEPARGLDGKGLLFTLYGVTGVPHGDVRAYLHDGTGAATKVRFGPVSTSTSEQEADTVPPESIDVALVPASETAPRLLVALGDDVGTGVARYEVSIDGVWREFTPPMEIPEDADGRIMVRIFDHAGNFREVIVQEPAETHAPVAVIATLIVLVAGVLYLVLSRRARRPH